MSALLSWSEATQGNLPLRQALDSLRLSVRACHVVLSRHAARKGPGLISHQPPGEPACRHSYVDSVLGRYAASPRPGSVWLASQSDAPDNADLLAWQERLRLADLAIVSLRAENGEYDFLEFHVPLPLDRRDETRLAEAGPLLARTWMRRLPGLFSEAVLSTARADAAPDRHILDPANPVALSRSEYRVCLLLSRGLASNGICAEMNISAATLKSHLRNIYAKTGCASQAELVFRLLSRRPPDPGRKGGDLRVA